MKTRMKILLISAVSAIGVAAGAAGIAAATSDGAFSHAGWGKHRGAELVCSQGEERLEDVVAFARFRLDIRDDQMTEWNAFAEAVRTGGDELLTTCERLDALQEGDAPARLAEVEMLMEKALGATRRIRGAFDPLYAALDEDQRATVERLTRHRHGRHHGYGDGETEEKKG
ncbi:MAG: hypothetical protein TEF_20500 [Rhizobiales bacterium NRL2]|jgi:hypothetical protein|nr:MAG: hypothetical protein TEF_20500 [Rhizobiales bacterium NRL2]